MKIPTEFAPYFQCVFIFAVSICKSCGVGAKFESNHEEMSDEWWLDEAKAMKESGWVVPEELKTYCSECAKKLNIKHDPNAYAIDTDNF